MNNYRKGFKKYLDDLGKPKPAPGGGSVVCLIFCTGISLIEKAINFSSPANFKKQLKKLQAIRKRIYFYIDRDGYLFDKIIVSRGKARTRAIKSSESLVIDLGQASLEVFFLAKEVKSGIKKGIISDFNIGLECAKIALLGCICNLDANEKMFGVKSEFINSFKKSLKKWQ